MDYWIALDKWKVFPVEFYAALIGCVFTIKGKQRQGKLHEYLMMNILFNSFTTFKL